MYDDIHLPYYFSIILKYILFNIHLDLGTENVGKDDSDIE